MLADRAVWVRSTAYSDQDLPPSPCVSVCRMDEAAGVCQGCLRTLDELRLWSTANAEQRLRVWAAVEQRLQQRHPQAWAQALADADH
ncbi:DUF1289 domain-containing protein [Curvibacter sp. CHRR-16]|nr:DUF1289 domain-containing protein [Curvibacter sp. CHRR-16]MBT0569932.1 DUF1289 domain-containing protein [Curvibacter sp. CHRR-16]